MEPNLKNLNVKSVLDNFFENDPLDEPKRCRRAKSQEDGQKRKMVIKIEFTPLSDCNIFPFFKGFWGFKNKHFKYEKKDI